MQPSLPMDLPPPPKTVHRPHTGTRFWKEHAEAADVAEELLREGYSISDVAREVGPMCGRDPQSEDRDTGIRKHLQALIVLRRIDLAEIARFRMAVVRDGAAEKMLEVIPNATHKELGALSMAATQAHQIERNLGGEANVVVEHRITGMPTFAQLKAEAAQLAAQSTGEIIEAQILPAVPEKEEARRQEEEYDTMRTITLMPLEVPTKMLPSGPLPWVDMPHFATLREVIGFDRLQCQYGEKCYLRILTKVERERMISDKPEDTEQLLLCDSVCVIEFQPGFRGRCPCVSRGTEVN